MAPFKVNPFTSFHIHSSLLYTVTHVKVVPSPFKWSTVDHCAFLWSLQWSTVWLESLTVVPIVITFSAVDHCEFIWGLQWSTVALESLTVVSFVTAPFKVNHCTSISHAQ